MTTSLASLNVRSWFSPERILVALPIVFGIGTGALVLMVGVAPVSVKLQQIREEVEIMELKQIGLPALQKRLGVLERELQNTKDQQTRVMALISGPNPLKTLLASLNELAAKEGVDLTAVNPNPVVPYVAPVPASEPNEGGATELSQQLPADPLLRPGLERRSVVLTLEGTFPALLGFLRELEALEVITITNELNLLNSGQVNEPTQLNLSLSAYGRT